MKKQRIGPPLVGDAEFEHIKDESRRIYAYANRVLTLARDWDGEDDAGFALFDPSGCLLKLYGSSVYQDLCVKRGILPRSMWLSEPWPDTAVSRGIREKRYRESRGKANPPPLDDLDISFMPLLLEGSSPGSFDLLGGIAYIAPTKNAVKEMKLVCSALANDIILHMFMSKELYNTYFQEPRGLIDLDINVLNGSIRTLYHNDQVFQILGIPYEPLYFKKAEEFFDPLPANKRFWAMVNNREALDEEPMTISVHGRKDPYIVTTQPYHQSHLNIGGIKLLLSSPRALSSHVAHHIGNNALYSFSNILGNSSVMQRSIAQAKAIARSDSNVMITGESGVGKDIFAQAIHNASRRSGKPFIVLNCAAYPRDLLASELFGYDGGAYTGAKKDGNIGKFELADSGTIFLDEIGDMPLDLQVMLLRVIEQKEFMRIGSNVVRSVDVKIISATNADLQSMVEKHTFRSDLYFRLSTLRLRLPPLRERGEDVTMLSRHFINVISSRAKLREPKQLAPETLVLLKSLPWSGNVRELQNVMERAVQLVPSNVITPADLEMCLDFPLHSSPPEPPAERITEKKRPSVSREDILRALENCHYNRTLAAASLGVSRKTFYRKLEEYNIEL